MSGVPEPVLRLIDKFALHRDAYTAGEYREEELRSEFLDLFFEALGWDVYNRSNAAEAYKDLVREESMRAGAPDYCFRIGGIPKFFVEAKKPSVDIAGAPAPAYQLRRYAWSARLPLSILTDFQEFAVYDCRIPPRVDDASRTARRELLTFEHYPSRWDWLSETFSKQAVLQGAFDRYAESKKGRGAAPVDVAFLKEIEAWREHLAKNIALRNRRLSVRDLNCAVQRVIDRIVFLRMCEDRGVEPLGQLQALLNGTEAYPRLLQLFRQADDRYNSGLFHFAPEPDRPEAPDTLTPGLAIDDRVLKDIVRSLYYPASPYEFSVLPPDILGNVYEQFLGKVIHLTPGGQARVEEKPEVKKAGGVYYTPKYIVDYIVSQTIGALLGQLPTSPKRGTGGLPCATGGLPCGTGGLPTSAPHLSLSPPNPQPLSPRQISKLRILDPACGSGSFLVGAYRTLLDYHRDWYLADGADKHTREIYQGAGGQWFLSTPEKKRILLNNIFGVDIDPQAVEVTKLNLLLCVLENENQSSLRQLALIHQRALPDLGDNVKCGNSLIGPDFYRQSQLDLFDDETRYRINAFDWSAEFPSIMKSGGFDAVIGNPPYVLLQTLDQRPVFEYLAGQFQTAKYKIDTYQLFLEKGLRLGTKGAKLGYITPNTFLRNKYARTLRNLILEMANVDVLRLFYFPVFRRASVDTSVIILSKTAKPNPQNQIEVICSNGPDEPLKSTVQIQKQWLEHPTKDFSLPGPAGSADLAAKIVGASCLLGDFATAYFGIQTFDRDRYVTPRQEAKHSRPVVDGVNITRYALLQSNEFVDFRPASIKSGGKEHVYEQDRIGVRQIGEVPIATLIPAGLYTLNTVYNIFFTSPTHYSLRFILGLICSKAIGWYWRRSFFDQKGTFPKIKKDALLSLPVPSIDFSNPTDKSRHDRMVQLVNQMLDLHKQLAAAKNPHEQTTLQRQIASTDNQIDTLTYELYSLTPDEIRIVEKSST